MHMSVKAETSNRYLQLQKATHGDKKWDWHNIRAMITGAQKDKSIGRDIATSLSLWANCKKVWTPKFDVRDMLDTFEGSYNALIVSHGVTYLDWFEDLSYSKMAEIVNVNLFGVANVIQEFVNATLATDERKRIIIIGSMAHRSVLNGSAVYCASKAGVAMLARCLAWELAPKGFDVFCIHPSNTEGTPMTKDTIAGLERYRGLTHEEAESYWNDSPIRKQMLTTHDIAKLVKFLLEPGSEYLAGAQLELAGGQR